MGLASPSNKGFARWKNVLTEWKWAELPLMAGWQSGKTLSIIGGIVGEPEESNNRRVP